MMIQIVRMTINSYYLVGNLMLRVWSESGDEVHERDSEFDTVANLILHTSRSRSRVAFNRHLF